MSPRPRVKIELNRYSPCTTNLSPRYRFPHSCWPATVELAPKILTGLCPCLSSVFICGRVFESASKHREYEAIRNDFVSLLIAYRFVTTKVDLYYVTWVVIGQLRSVTMATTFSSTFVDAAILVLTHVRSGFITRGGRNVSLPSGRERNE